MEQMTKERLEAYQSMQEEVRELKYKLQHLGEGESMVDSSTINDYRSGYPVPQAVVGVDWDKVDRLYDRYMNRIAKLQKECNLVEEYIESIEDSVTRRIFRMYYLEGMSQKDVGVAVHIDRSRVSRKIEIFLKTHTKHKKHSYNNT